MRTQAEKLKATKRFQSNLRAKHKLRIMYQQIQTYPSPVQKISDDSDKVLYYRPTYKSSHSERYAYYKNQSNRAIRRKSKLECKKAVGSEYDSYSLDRGLCKRVYEYAWNVD